MLTYISYILHTAVRNVQIVQIGGGLQLCDCTSTGSAGGVHSSNPARHDLLLLYILYILYILLFRGTKCTKCTKRYHCNQAVTVAQLVGRCGIHVRCGVRTLPDTTFCFRTFGTFCWSSHITYKMWLLSKPLVRSHGSEVRSLPLAILCLPTKCTKCTKCFFFGLCFPTFDRHPCMI